MIPESVKLNSAWENYYQTVAEARAAIEATERFRQCPEHRAQALHALMEAQGMAYTQFIAPRLNNARVYTSTYLHPTVFTLGQTCGDCIYSLLALDGRQTYRVTARTGDIKVMLMQIHSHPHGHPDCEQIGNYDLMDFEPDADGSIEIIFSATEQTGNWIPLNRNSRYNYVQVRRFFGNWFDDLGGLDIEIVERAEGYDESSEAAMAQRIEWAAGFVTYLIRKWTIGLYERYIVGAGGKNRFYYMPGKTVPDLLGSAATVYLVSVLECGADEALIIEMEVPDAPYWSFQLGDVWSKPQENIFNQTDINMNRAAIDSDGRFRCVISHRDPGVQNWMEVVGNRTEFICVGRIYNEIGDPVPPPTIKAVKLAELHEHLPADTATTTAKKRRRDLEYRCKGVKHIYDSI